MGKSCTEYGVVIIMHGMALHGHRYHGNNVVGPSSDLKDVKENPRFSIMFSSLRLKHGGQKEKEADISR